MENKVDNKKKSIGLNIIASTIIWGAVIIGCAFKLKGTECYNEISLILYGGVIAHIILIWVPLAGVLNKLKDKKSEDG